MGDLSMENNVLAKHVQHYGVLVKRPFGHQSSKWCRRFFLVRDGFLLYYPETERKDFEKRKCFNLHPKGIVPLGRCVIEAISEPGHPFAIQLSSLEVDSTLVLAAESEFDQEKWVNKLRESARITFRNAQFGDNIIQQLEMHGLEMAKERQDYLDKLQGETIALYEEKQKTEELEKARELLEREKDKIEQFAKDLREEYDKIKLDFRETVEMLQAVQVDKDQMYRRTEQLQSSLEELHARKQQTLLDLQKRSNSDSPNLAVNHCDHALGHAPLSPMSDGLQENLNEIEERTRRLLEEKATAESRLREIEEKAEMLEREKNTFSDLALELQQSLKELSNQKASTEAELKEEILARVQAENRLKEAESSLARLEKAVKGDTNAGENSEEVKEQMIGDVKTLKKFFEKLAFEDTLESNKTAMIQKAMYRRKNWEERANTLRVNRSRRSTDLNLSASMRSANLPASLQRSVTMSTTPANRSSSMIAKISPRSASMTTT